MSYVRKGQIAVGVVVAVGTLVAGWLFLGVNKAQETADAANIRSEVNSSQITEVNKRLERMDLKLDEILKKVR